MDVEPRTAVGAPHLPTSPLEYGTPALHGDARTRWNRWRRFLLLFVSSVLVAAVLIAARDVLLPFILALVLAYVLMPLVAWVERSKIPRGGAILIVYALVLGSFYLFVRAAAPRMGQELRGIRGEVPGMVATVREKWIPDVQQRLRAFGIAAPEAPPADPRSPETKARRPSSRVPGPTARSPSRSAPVSRSPPTDVGATR